MTAERDSLILDSVESAIADIAAGKAVVVVDDEDRENEGDLIFAADLATPELVAFMVRYTSGYICVAMEDDRADALNLPPMVARNEDARSTAYTVTVDAATGSTGISARSRCETITRLADENFGPEAFTRPGHIVPLRARRGGVLTRDGHTEASVDLSRLAGQAPVGVLCEIVSEDDPTDMARGPELRRFADEHGLRMVSIEQLIEYRRATEQTVERNTEARLPTTRGEFRAVGYTSLVDGTEHVALVHGDVTGQQDVPVRVHSECLTGDVFGSLRCDCGEQLHAAMDAVQDEGHGVVIYLRNQEGRGIGLVPKLRAYVLQDEGLDTVEANTALGLPADAREYSAAASIIKELGIESVHLISNNPAKKQSLENFGVSVTGRIPVQPPATKDNARYLQTKRDKMGHQLDNLNVVPAAATAEKEN